MGAWEAARMYLMALMNPNCALQAPQDKHPQGFMVPQERCMLSVFLKHVAMCVLWSSLIAGCAPTSPSFAPALDFTAPVPAAQPQCERSR